MKALLNNAHRSNEGFGLNDWASFLKEANNFSSIKTSRLVMKLTQPTNQWIPGLKQPSVELKIMVF
jgi:hypothetical protein